MSVRTRPIRSFSAPMVMIQQRHSVASKVNRSQTVGSVPTVTSSTAYSFVRKQVSAFVHRVPPTRSRPAAMVFCFTVSALFRFCTNQSRFGGLLASLSEREAFPWLIGSRALCAFIVPRLDERGLDRLLLLIIFPLAATAVAVVVVLAMAAGAAAARDPAPSLIRILRASAANV